MIVPLAPSRTAGRRPGRAWLLVAVLVTAGLTAVTTADVTATNLSDFTVVPATGGTGISPATAGGAWTTLTGPAIEVAVYSNPDVFPTGLVFTLTLPANFEWNAAVTARPTVSVAPGMPAGFCSLVPSRLTYAGLGDAPRTARFAVSGTHDVGCVVTLRGLQVRPISADPRAGSGGNLTVDWGAPSLGASRAAGGVVSLATTAASSLPPTSTATEQATPPSAPGLMVVLSVLLAAGSLCGRRLGTRWSALTCRGRGGR